MKPIYLLLSLSLFLVSCNSQPQTTPYEVTKKIVIDTRKSDEGKKALYLIFEDATFRELLTLQEDEVNTALKQTLLSKEAEDFWNKKIEDPQFKEAFAKSLFQQQK